MELFSSSLLVSMAASAAVALGSVLLLWLVSMAIRDVSIIDMFFAVILMAITGACLYLSEATPVRQWLVTAMVGIWGIRITFHLIRRNWGHGEDPRYTKLRSWAASDRAFNWLALRQVFLLQGVVLWFVALPIQFSLGQGSQAEPGFFAWAGLLVWAVGFGVEWIADEQLRKFKANPELRGTVLQSGLWRYSRHPNYFGELCVWWGIFLVACEVPWGWLTIIGPIVYSYLVINVTGQRTLDKKLAREKPGYQQYMERTSGLIPLPPRKSPA